MKDLHNIPERLKDTKENIKLSDRVSTQYLYKVNRQLSQIIGFLPAPTFAIDKTGRVIFWNKLMEEMTGVHSKDILWG